MCLNRNDSQKMNNKSFLAPTFLGYEELQVLCRDPMTAEESWKSFIQTGANLMKAEVSDTAFLELGGALQIAHSQLTQTREPSWHWALRFVESTNIIVVALNEMGHKQLVDPLLISVKKDISALRTLSGGPKSTGNTWLRQWCEAMQCPGRQAQLASVYLRNVEKVPKQTLH